MRIAQAAPRPGAERERDAQQRHDASCHAARHKPCGPGVRSICTSRCVYSDDDIPVLGCLSYNSCCSRDWTRLLQIIYIYRIWIRVELGFLGAPAVCRAPEGTRSPQPIMQSAGPANAIPCTAGQIPNETLNPTLLVVVSLQPPFFSLARMPTAIL